MTSRILLFSDHAEKDKGTGGKKGEKQRTIQKNKDRDKGEWFSLAM